MRKLLALSVGCALLGGTASGQDIPLRVAGNLLASGLME